MEVSKRGRRRRAPFGSIITIDNKGEVTLKTGNVGTGAVKRREGKGWSQV